jgi:hypothetical protein
MRISLEASERYNSHIIIVNARDSVSFIGNGGYLDGTVDSYINANALGRNTIFYL